MPSPNDIMGMKRDTFCMLLHLSQLLMFCFPLAIAVPVVLWAINKDKCTLVDQHGKMIVNWLITFLIAISVSVVLWVAGIGLFPLPIVLGLAIFFSVYGGIKANDGIVWNYSISSFQCYYPFLK